jgi:hypothetical protein
LDPIRLWSARWRDFGDSRRASHSDHIRGVEVVTVSMDLTSDDIERIKMLMAFTEILHKSIPSYWLERELPLLHIWFDSLITRYTIADILQNG